VVTSISLFGPQPQHRTVISDAGEEGTIPAPRASLERHSADVGNESFFLEQARRGEIIAQTDPLRACGTESGHAPIPSANDRNQPLDRVRLPPLK